MNTRRWLWLPLVVVPLVLIGCNRGSDSPKDKLYDVKGKVLAVDLDKQTLRLDHEDIPGLMKAMKMEFRVESGKLVEGLKPGDEVQGKLRKTDAGYLITELKKR